MFFSGGRTDDGNPQKPCIMELGEGEVTAVAIGGLIDPAARNQSASVLLPLPDQQKVLIIGRAPLGDNVNATESVNVVDLRDPKPTFVPGAPLGLPRVHLNAVLLPDHTVLVCGGSLQRESEALSRRQAEIYDPDADTCRRPQSPPYPASTTRQPCCFRAPRSSPRGGTRRAAIWWSGCRQTPRAAAPRALQPAVPLRRRTPGDPRGAGRGGVRRDVHGHVADRRISQLGEHHPPRDHEPLGRLFSANDRPRDHDADRWPNLPSRRPISPIRHLPAGTCCS